MKEGLNTPAQATCQIMEARYVYIYVSSKMKIHLDDFNEWYNVWLNCDLILSFITILALIKLIDINLLRR